MFVPLAPTALKLAVGLRRPCWGKKVCGGMLEAMARNAPARGEGAHITPARPATPHSTKVFCVCFVRVLYRNSERTEVRLAPVSNQLQGGLVPNKISGVVTIFGLLVHVLPGPTKQRGLKSSTLLR
jgi:hypothetical protein